MSTLLPKIHLCIEIISDLKCCFFAFLSQSISEVLYFCQRSDTQENLKPTKKLVHHVLMQNGTLQENSVEKIGLLEDTNKGNSNPDVDREEDQDT